MIKHVNLMGDTIQSITSFTAFFFSCYQKIKAFVLENLLPFSRVGCILVKMKHVCSSLLLEQYCQFLKVPACLELMDLEAESWQLCQSRSENEDAMRILEVGPGQSWLQHRENREERP